MPRFLPALVIALLTAGAATAVPAQEPALGFTAPSREVEVSTVVRGLVRDLLVSEGERVAAGQALARIDAAELEAELAIARARAAAEGGVRRAQALLAAKQQQYDRLAKLRQQGAARAEEVALAEAELRVAEADMVAATEQQKIAELEVMRLEALLDQHLVLAPSDGVVTEILREPGELVGAQETRVLALAVLDPLQIEVFVPNALGRRLERGMPAQVDLADLGLTVTGTIADVAVKADAASGTMRVRVHLANDDGRLRSGERAMVSFGSVAAASQ